VLLAVAPLAVSHGRMWHVLLPERLAGVTHRSQQSKGKLRGNVLGWEVVRLRRAKERCWTLRSSGRAVEPFC